MALNQQFGAYRVDLTAATVTTGGAVAAVKNPEGETLLIERVLLYIKTASTGAATVDVGVAANGTTTSDTLIDGKSVATAGAFDNITDIGTNGKSRQTWGATEYVTVTASATLAGMVGYLYIEYRRTTG